MILTITGNIKTIILQLQGMQAFYGDKKKKKKKKAEEKDGQQRATNPRFLKVFSR